MLKGYSVPAVVTGKPLEIGGSLGRVEATGRGATLTLLSYLEKVGEKGYGMTVAVQGFGNVGGTGAKLLAEQGFKVVAINDVDGTVYNPDGINVPLAIEYAQAHRKTLAGYEEPGVKKISAKEFWALPVDILFPAAMENQINEDNAGSIKAGIILEGANGPTTVEADAILNRKGVVIIPDILANACGVVVSYFEWVQNLEAFTWEEDEINHKLAQIMEKAFAEVWRVSNEKKVPLRMAAYMVALDRVVKARKLRGIFP